MNTPGKEALDAACDLFKHRYCYGSDNDNAAIIDRHFEPLRQRSEQAEARVKELQKQEAESRRLFYAEQDKRQSAEQRNAELEAEYRDLRVAYEQNASQCVQLNRELGLKIDTVEWLNGTAIQRERAEQAEARNAELEDALRGMIKNAERDGDTRLAVQRALAALARAETARKEVQP